MGMILAALQILLTGFLSMFSSMPAAAQNPDATPTYGVEEIAAPIGEEPFELRVQAGGPLDGRDMLPEGCRGFIASAPDFDLDYLAADVGLQIAVQSDADTTLAVSDPDGGWHCSDDADGLMPIVLISSPPSGRYTIWVGTYRESRSARSTLVISDYVDQALSD